MSELAKEVKGGNEIKSWYYKPLATHKHYLYTSTMSIQNGETKPFPNCYIKTSTKPGKVSAAVLLHGAYEGIVTLNTADDVVTIPVSNGTLEVWLTVELNQYSYEYNTYMKLKYTGSNSINFWGEMFASAE